MSPPIPSYIPWGTIRHHCTRLNWWAIYITINVMASKCGDVGSFADSSWCRFQFYEQIKPVFVGYCLNYIYRPCHALYLMDARDGNGMEAWIIGLYWPREICGETLEQSSEFLPRCSLRLCLNFHNCLIWLCSICYDQSFCCILWFTSNMLSKVSGVWVLFGRTLLDLVVSLCKFITIWTCIVVWLCIVYQSIRYISWFESKTHGIYQSFKSANSFWSHATRPRW